jgi:hypothetical protein
LKIFSSEILFLIYSIPQTRTYFSAMVASG